MELPIPLRSQQCPSIPGGQHRHTMPIVDLYHSSRAQGLDLAPQTEYTEFFRFPTSTPDMITMRWLPNPYKLGLANIKPDLRL